MDHLVVTSRLAELLIKPEIIQIEAAIQHFREEGHLNCKNCSMIRDMTHWIYRRRIGLGDSGGLDSIWIHRISEARQILAEFCEREKKDNFSRDEAIKRLIDATIFLKEILEAHRQSARVYNYN